MARAVGGFGPDGDGLGRGQGEAAGTPGECCADCGQEPPSLANSKGLAVAKRRRLNPGICFLPRQGGEGYGTAASALTEPSAREPLPLGGRESDFSGLAVALLRRLS